MRNSARALASVRESKSSARHITRVASNKEEGRHWGRSQSENKKRVTFDEKNISFYFEIDGLVL